MTRERFWYCRERQKLISYNEEFPPSPPKFGTSAYVIGDFVEPVYSHVDGKYYTSKRAMEREAEAQGFVCVGNEIPNRRPEYLKEQEVKEEAHREEAFERAWSDLTA